MQLINSNYCKNLYFYNMHVCSFDAHKGTYNATLVDSTCEHINFIGEGTITLKNMTVYVGPKKTGLVFRSDYGSTWEGDVIIDGLDLRYPQSSASSSAFYLELIQTKWTNHDFGYITYLPKTIRMSNVTTSAYTVSVTNGVRKEVTTAVNEFELHIYKQLESYPNVDISNPNADMSNYPNDNKICTCESGFVDENADGLCDNKRCKSPETTDRSKNMNPFIPTESIYIENCPGLKIIFPNTPQFNAMKVFVDGEEYDWINNGASITVPGEPPAPDQQ